MNSTPKSELISILMDGLQTPTEVPEADMKTCVLINGHALIQTLGKPHGCHIFGDYADVFMQTVTRHFGEHTTRVDVVFDCYVVFDRYNDLVEVSGQEEANFANLSRDNMSHFHKFGVNSLLWMRTKPILPSLYLVSSEQYELVAGGGFSHHTDARSTRRDDIRLHGNHEEADTRLILHSCEAVNA